MSAVMYVGFGEPETPGVVESRQGHLSEAELDANHLQLEAEYFAAQIAYKAAQARVDELGRAYLNAQCWDEVGRRDGRDRDGRSVVRVTRCNLRKGHSGEHRNTFVDREEATS